jgi:hypothetical protein
MTTTKSLPGGSCRLGDLTVSRVAPNGSAIEPGTGECRG